ncbi:MAG TPA: NAD(P)/FAD-dependent oxidoreductase [Acidimicrobiales bacterium]|nr:NAD(P)/FAD-dependent oxidoreductase [Acidimicrobiales bacterium]
MSRSVDRCDAIVIGSGPNGLTAAATLAAAGWSVTVLEGSEVAGGAIASEALTAPGYVHDTYSAFYGILHESPVFNELELGRRVDWARFDVPVAAAVRPGAAGLCHADPAATAKGLGLHDAADEANWLELCAWWEKIGRRFFAMTIGPIPSLPPLLKLLAATRVRAGLELAQLMLAPMDVAASQKLRSEVGRTLLASGASHADLSIASSGSAPGAIILALVAQMRNMPVPVGGAGRLADAMVAAVTDCGGSVITGARVARVVVERGRAVGVETVDGRTFRARRAVLADVNATKLFGPGGLVPAEGLPPSFLDALSWFRSGSGVFKLDVALNAPAPWTDEGFDRAGVVHIVGSCDDMVRAAGEVGGRMLPTEPMLIVGQQTIADPSRAPSGGHTLWIETHVPGQPREGAWSELREPFLDRVLDRIEVFAPGLRSHIVGTAVHTPPDLEARNPNLVGGDLAGGSISLHQQLVFRPARGWFRYNLPIKGLYICSASAHPGGGVHGMVGRNCARRVLGRSFTRRAS